MDQREGKRERQREGETERGRDRERGRTSMQPSERMLLQASGLYLNSPLAGRNEVLQKNVWMGGKFHSTRRFM